VLKCIALHQCFQPVNLSDKCFENCEPVTPVLFNLFGRLCTDANEKILLWG